MTRDRIAMFTLRGLTTHCRLLLLIVVAAGSLQACSDAFPLMPAPALYTGSAARQLFTSVPADGRKPELDLLYLTNRAAAVETEDGQPYSAERSASLTFGSAIVRIGDNLDWASLSAASVAERRGSELELSLGQVQELGRFPGIPYSVERTATGLIRSPATVAAHEAAAAALQAEVARRLAASPRKELVLFIHGYNNQFRTAALTISEMCHFLGREFVCGLFSWPAGGTRGLLMGYNVDRESAEYSALHLKQAIRLIGQTPGLERLHLVAHSRGTDLLVTVADQLMTESYVMGEQWVKRHKVANIVLLAPDIDSGVAAAKVFAVMSDPDLPAGGRKPAPDFKFDAKGLRVTVYTSPDDRALSLSEWLFGSLLRLGRLNTTELTPRQIARITPLEKMFNFIQVSGRTDLFGHSYFTSNPAVSSDLIAMLRYNEDPGQAQRPLEHVGGPFWRIPGAR